MRVNRVLKFAVAYTLAAASSMALAQAPEATVTELETVIVTGSYIKGAAEDAALPVDVVTAEDLQKQGSPSMVELVKQLPSSQGVMGDANQFSAGYSLGSANINLRGLGSARTLVLMNGRRLPPNPAVGVGVDVNLLPTAAIGRIEVLKDGAAATYGSDAVAGVVNFITKTKLDGLELDAAYSYIDGSDGEYSANAAFGWQGDTTDLLFTAGYRHRSALPVVERSWALPPYERNPSGGWTGAGNPGTFTVGGVGQRIVDPQCANLGGVATYTPPTGQPNAGRAGTPAAPVGATPTGCQTRYLALDNLIEDEDHYQVYAQLNQEIGSTIQLHAEGLYAAHTAIEHSSPSYLPTQGPTGFTAGGANSAYFVPWNSDPALSNPGYAGLLPQLTAGQVSAIQNPANMGVTIGPIFGALWRPLLVSGNPLTGGAKEDERDFDSFRFSVGLTGDITDSLSWDTAVTYGETTNETHTPDIYVARMGLALAGLGGPNCTGSTPGASGCEWLNPFSTAISSNIITGQQSTVAPTAPNSTSLVRWLFGDFGYVLTQSVLSVDAGLNGELAWNLPGGNIGWAAGLQYRENGIGRDPVDDTDPAVSPCPQSIINPAATCAVSSGVLSFNSPLYAYDLKQDVAAAYAEINLPILDSLNAQLAVRYEDYGGGIGDTTNPKLAVRYQPIDAVAFRGSVGTTFRAPAATTVVPGLLFTGNTFVAQASSYKPFDNYGNPDLKPEQALAFNVGTIVKLGGFTGSIDYWSFELEDAIVAESGTDMINTFAKLGADGCASPLAARFSFNSGVCGAVTTISRVRIQTSNAQEIDVSGVDADFNYAFGLGAGELTAGVGGTYNLAYEASAVLVEGVQVAEARDYVGTRGGTAASQPRWKGSAYLDYNIGDHNIRATARHISAMHDIRGEPSLTTYATSYAGFRDGDPGSRVEAITTFDLSYVVTLPGATTVAATVFNVTDEDPSFARTDLSYDSNVGSPAGRTIKVGVSKKF